MTRFKVLRSRLLAGPPNLPWTITLGLTFVVAPTLLRMAADRLITGTSFATYYPFVLAAAVVIGWRGAAVVALASALLANFLFMAPRYVLFGKIEDTLGAALFLVSCALMIALVDTLRRTAIELEAGREREAALIAEMKHLNTEMQHRVRNTLAVVQGLATHTFRGAVDEGATLQTFHGRVHALDEANAVLATGDWDRCRMPDLAVRALAPFSAGGALHLSGPPCELPKDACTPLVLALHELGTNAVKYGALSSLAGTVEVSWNLEPAADGTRALVLYWTEAGGPPVRRPNRKGLGSRLIAPQRGIDEASLDFRPEGLVCRLVVGGAVSKATP